MSFAARLVQAYFDYAYNRVYDSTATRFGRYQELQRQCIDRLELRDGDFVLCVGIGTGNETHHLLKANDSITIVGVDFSRPALGRARRKALTLGGEIETHLMNAKQLGFAGESFDRVLCIHVTDFVDEHEKVAQEILRVLREEGRFVITYPSYGEGIKLGLALLKDSIRYHIDSGRHPAMAVLQSLARLLVGIVYLPLMFRPGKRSYSRPRLETMMTGLGVSHCSVEEDTVYNDFVVAGIKSKTKGVRSDAF